MPFLSGAPILKKILDPPLKRVRIQSLSHENEFHLHENELLGGTHSPINGFA